MSEQDFARFLLLISGVTLLGTLGTGGAAEAAVRFVVHTLKLGSGIKLARTLSSAFALAITLGTALACFIVPIAASIVHLFDSTSDAPPNWFFVIAALSVPAFSIRAVAAGLIRGFGALTLATAFEGTLVSGLLATFAAYIIVAEGATSLWAASMAFGTASIVTGALAVLTVAHFGARASGRTLGLAVPKFRECIELLNVGAPLLTAGVLGLLVGQMMIWLVAWLGTLRDVAAFGLGWQLFQAVNLFAMVGQASLGPRIVALSLEERRDALNRFLSFAAALLAVGTLVTLLAVTLAAATLDGFVANGLSQGAVMVAVLLGLGRCGQLVLGVNTTTLAMTGGELEVRRTALFCGAAMLGLAPLLFFIAGTIGVAVAGALYFIGYGVMTACAVRRRLGFWPIARLKGGAAWTR